MKYGPLIALHDPSQSHWELNERIDVRRVLEVGMHRGGSARVWRDALQPELLIGINERDEIEGERHGICTVFGRSQDPIIQQQVLDLLAGAPLDFLFVDGGHYYDEVRSDFELYSPLVRAGGVATFHDVRLTGPTAEVHRYWCEVAQGRRTKVVWDGTDAGTGIGVVFL